MSKKEAGKQTKNRQQSIKSMFNSLKKRNNKSWNKRQPGMLPSSPNKHHLECNHKPHITIESQSQQHQKQPISKQKLSRKRKFHMISSPTDYNTLVIDNDEHRVKRLKTLSVSPSKGSERRKYKDRKHQNPFSSFTQDEPHSIEAIFNENDIFELQSPNPTHKTIETDSVQSSKHLFISYDDDQTPARTLNRMTQFRRQRVLNPIHNINVISPTPSSISTSNGKTHTKRKKIIIESDVDPRRLSLEEHPIMVKQCEHNIYSQDLEQKQPEETAQLTAILDGLLSTTYECEEIDYFDDDLDENALLIALHDIDEAATHTTNNNVIKRLSFDQNQHDHDAIQPNITNIQPIKSHLVKYFRFQVMEILMNHSAECVVLRVKDLKQYELEDIDRNDAEWSIELREDWFMNRAIICVNDIIHVIGETAHKMRMRYTKQYTRNGNGNGHNIQYPKHMIPNENIPMIQDEIYCVIIDNTHNYLVLHPDCLMIPTRIASSFPCSRSQVLLNNVRFKEEKDVLLFGTMAHELFERRLKGNTRNIHCDIDDIIKKYMIVLYAINETKESASKKLSEFIDNINDFLNKYISNQSNVDWGSYTEALNITKIMDIEENIWSPMFGILGNLDSTLQIQTTTGHKIVPFELKTGKESDFGKLRARAQLAMYSLMIADRYDTVPTTGGLLYFLKTGHLMGIPLPHNEIRALLIRRNFLAKYFNSYLKIDEEEEKRFKQKEFPPLLTIADKRSCQNCFQKNSCFIYHKMQCYNEGVNDICSEYTSSMDEYTDMVGDLSDNALEYICKWIECIDLEETYCLGTRHEIWSMSSSRREAKNGKCLGNMSIIHYEVNGFKHIYTFKKDEREDIKLWDLKFSVGAYLIVSTETGKYGVGKGTVIELNALHLRFASYKPIKVFNAKYRLDMDDSNGFGFSGLRANVFYYFMDNNDDEMTVLIERKRALWIDLVSPTFCNVFNEKKIPQHLLSAYNTLNIDQQNAVKHVIDCNDYALILGMPGTGKSSTIIFLLRLLISFGLKLMLTAFTNLSIDHLCLKLLKYQDTKDKFVRIGSTLSVHNKLTDYVLGKNNTNERFQSIANLASYVESKQIFAVTSHSSTTNCIIANKCGIFDYCIMDEAGQLTEPQCLGPLRKCRKFILVGDSNQLPPLVQCAESIKKGMDISLFERLYKKHGDIACKSLTIQYRMNKDIMFLGNTLIYNGKMKCASNDIAQQKIKGIQTSLHKCDKAWLKYAMDPNNNVILFNTDGLYSNTDSAHKRNVNHHEAHMIERMVNIFMKNGILSSQIGIMAPYRSQLKLIKSKLNTLNVRLSPSQKERNNENLPTDLLLDTIDRFQGSDRDIIVISFTHSPQNHKVGKILKDWRRINVALTRAKLKLILIASISAFNKSKSNILQKIIQVTNQQKWVYHVDMDDIY